MNTMNHKKSKANGLHLNSFNRYLDRRNVRVYRGKKFYRELYQRALAYQEELKQNNGDDDAF